MTSPGSFRFSCPALSKKMTAKYIHSFIPSGWGLTALICYSSNVMDDSYSGSLVLVGILQFVCLQGTLVTGECCYVHVMVTLIFFQNDKLLSSWRRKEYYSTTNSYVAALKDCRLQSIRTWRGGCSFALLSAEIFCFVFCFSEASISFFNLCNLYSETNQNLI